MWGTSTPRVPEEPGPHLTLLLNNHERTSESSMLDASERLRAAVISGNLQLTKRLLSRFPDHWLNIDPSNEGWCNLHYASYHGHYLICFHLVSIMRQDLKRDESLESLCRLDLITFDGRTVLHMPLQHHHSQTLHYLLQEFSSFNWVDHKGGKYSRTPLQDCCVYKFSEGLKLLLEFGADWTVQDIDGDTCLHLCFAYGNISCIHELLKIVILRRLQQLRTKNEKAKTSDGPTAVKTIKQSVMEEITKLEQVRNFAGCIPIQYAASFEIEREYENSKALWVQKAIDEEAELRSILEGDFLLDSQSLVFTTPTVTTFAASAIGRSQSRSSTDSDLVPVWSLATDLNDLELRHTLSESNNSAPVNPYECQDTSQTSLSLHRPIPLELDLSLINPERAPAQRKSPNVNGLLTRISPMKPRSALVSQHSQVLSSTSSPLNVEFHRTSSRKSVASTPLARQTSRFANSGIEDSPADVVAYDDLSSIASKSSTIVTPTSTLSGPHFFPSPVYSTRRKSFNATNAEKARMAPSQDATTQKRKLLLSRTSSFGLLRGTTMGGLLRRNVSTPAVLSTFGDLTPCSPLESKSAAKPLLRQLSSKILDITESGEEHSDHTSSIDSLFNKGLNISRVASKSNGHLVAESPNVFANASCLSKPRHSSERSAGSDKAELGRTRNVRSISFTRVREE